MYTDDSTLPPGEMVTLTVMSRAVVTFFISERLMSPADSLNTVGCVARNPIATAT